MKYLCCSLLGKVRAVAAKHILNEHKEKDALTVGLQNTSPATLDMLCKWASTILLIGTKEEMGLVPAAYHKKTMLFAMDDHYTDYHDHNLLKNLRRLMREKGIASKPEEEGD